MSKPNYQLEFTRQRIQGIFFCKDGAEHEACRKLVQDLGCQVLQEKSNRLTIQTSRGRLQELKRLYAGAQEEDKADISSRLQTHFDRILIGGSIR